MLLVERSVLHLPGLVEDFGLKRLQVGASLDEQKAELSELGLLVSTAHVVWLPSVLALFFSHAALIHHSSSYATIALSLKHGSSGIRHGLAHALHSSSPIGPIHLLAKAVAASLLHLHLGWVSLLLIRVALVLESRWATSSLCHAGLLEALVASVLVCIELLLLIEELVSFEHTIIR